MLLIKNAETNLVAFAVLGVILAHFHGERFNKGIPGRIFLWMVYSAMGALVLDSASWMLDGASGPAGIWLVAFTNALLFVCNPTTLLLWVMYVDYQIYADIQRIRAMKPFVVVIFAVNTVFSLVAPFAGGYFSVDGNAHYHRGPLFILADLLCIGVLAYGFFLILWNRNHVPRRHTITMLAFSFPPVVGTVLQSLMFGISLIWPSIAVSLLIVYTGIQNQQMTTDYLTGLYNRRELDRDLRRRIRDLRAGSVLGVLMLDLDNFKEINDRFGHAVGDHALETMAHLMRRCFHHEDLLARYGGDEFVCVLEMDSAANLETAARRLGDQIEVYNRMNPEPCLLGISMGGAVYDPADPLAADALLDLADRNMYREKERNKCKNMTT